MVGQIIPANQFNVAALQASGAYIAIINPPSYIQALPTDVIGLVGTASWGPVNQPVYCGNGVQAVQSLGPIGAAALTDPYDLATDLNFAFMQAQSQASLQAWAVRVTDGTDTAASSLVQGAAAGGAETITIGGTIASGNSVAISFTAAGITGSPVTVTVTAGTGATAGSMAAALKLAINANSALIAANVYATGNGAVVTVYTPTGLSVSYGAVLTPSTGGPTATLASGTVTSNGANLQALYTGSGGNLVNYTISAGTVTNSYTVTIVPPYGGIPEVFQNLPGTGFWPALKNAINNGNSAARPASQIVTVTTSNAAVGAPTTGTFLLSSGTDGRSGVTTATQLGNDTSTPKTGLYALRAQAPAVGIVWLVGNVDNTALASLLAFGTSEACCTLWAFPTGTSSSAAVTNLLTYGQNDPSVNVLKDWVYVNDTSNKQIRLIPPYAIIGGMWATYSPEQSPDNKPVYGVLGTERNPPNSSAQAPYAIQEIGMLQQAGIAIVTNPINAGAFWGTWGGRSTSTDPATKPSEYWRMTTYLARSLAAFGGKYVGQLQSQQPNDALRRQIKTELNAFFQFLVGNGQIDASQVLCEFTTNGVPGYGFNTPQSIAMHYLYVMIKVTYLSSVWYLILDFQGGTTVSVSATNSIPA